MNITIITENETKIVEVKQFWRIEKFYREQIRGGYLKEATFITPLYIHSLKLDEDGEILANSSFKTEGEDL